MTCFGPVVENKGKPKKAKNKKNIIINKRQEQQGNQFLGQLPRPPLSRARAERSAAPGGLRQVLARRSQLHGQRPQLFARHLTRGPRLSHRAKPTGGGGGNARKRGKKTRGGAKKKPRGKTGHGPKVGKRTRGKKGKKREGEQKEKNMKQLLWRKKVPSVEIRSNIKQETRQFCIQASRKYGAHTV